METQIQESRPPILYCVIEDPDGNLYTQRIYNDFDSLLHLKNSLGSDYWIVDIYV